MAAPVEEPSRTGIPWGRVAAVSAILAMVVLWAFVLTRRPPIPGQMDDPAFGKAAEPICAEAVAVVLTLPPAYTAADAAERAAVLRQADVAYATMLDRLEGIAPPTGTKEGDMAAEWLGDWRTYLGDRADLASRLETDPDARLFVTEKEGRQITQPIDRFAEVNGMPSCVTPVDLG